MIFFFYVYFISNKFCLNQINQKKKIVAEQSKERTKTAKRTMQKNKNGKNKHNSKLKIAKQ